MEDVMTDIMYEIPSREDVQKCIVSKEAIDKEVEPKLILAGQIEAADGDVTA